MHWLIKPRLPALFPRRSLVLIAEQAQSNGSVGVAFTYNEPLDLV